MTQADTVFDRVGDVDREHLAAHFEDAVQTLSRDGCVLRIEVEQDETEKSLFYREDNTRVYTISPEEHPVLVTAVDEFLSTAADAHGVDASRESPGERYVISVCDVCSQCAGSGGSAGSGGDGPGTRVSQCPFQDSVGVTCSDAEQTADSYVVTRSGEVLCGCDVSSVAALASSPVPETTVVRGESGFNCQSLTLAQDAVPPVLAKFIGLMDIIAFIRSHPLVGGPTRDSYRINESVPGYGEVVEEFQEDCETFTDETTTGWRLRWVLTIVDTDPTPVENIACAAQVPVAEAALMMTMLEIVGVVVESGEFGERAYRLSPEYSEWVAKHGEDGFLHAESAFLADTADVVEAIEQSYAALTSTA